MTAPQDRADGAELIARVEKATGPDRELDAAIWWTCYQGKPSRFNDAGKAEFFIENYDQGGRRPPKDTWVLAWDPAFPGAVSYMPYTASLDAVIALCERVLPGRVLGVRGFGTSWYADVRIDNADELKWADAGHKTPALALLLALLRALQPSEPSNG